MDNKSPRFAVKHIAKSQKRPPPKPKLVNKFARPTAQKKNAQLPTSAHTA
jgi:hypothetical protein